MNDNVGLAAKSLKAVAQRSGNPKEKAWTLDNAIAFCKQGIKDRALIPSEAEIHDIMGTTFSEAPVTHNVVLTMNFEAKNAFGVKIHIKPLVILSQEYWVRLIYP